MNNTSIPQPTQQYILTVLIHGYRRKVGKVYNEEELLKAIDLLPPGLSPEFELITPPKEEHLTRTVRPSWNSKREMEREWKKVSLHRCECGAVQVYEHYVTGERKCWECGRVNPKVRVVRLPKKAEWSIVEEKGV